MAASASLIDGEHSAKVVGLWDRLERELGVKAVRISPLPHFSYQAASAFDLDALVDVVAKVAAKARPLRIRTAGVGVFPGASPVVYIPIVRSPELTRLQLALWSAGAVATEKPLAHYHPASWIPHITIAQSDVTPELLPQVIAILNETDLSWDLEVDNLAIVRGRGDRPQELVGRYEMRGGSARNF